MLWKHVDACTCMSSIDGLAGLKKSGICFSKLQKIFQDREVCFLAVATSVLDKLSQCISELYSVLSLKG